MLRRLPSFILVLMVLILSPHTLAREYSKSIYPDTGILSKDDIGNRKAWGSTALSEDWVALRNEYMDRCKTYVPSITLAKLQKQLVFSEKDLLIMDADIQEKYGQNSVYFESCNYFHLGSSVIQTLEHLLNGEWRGWEEPEPLHWGDSDAYIDSEYLLLLVKYIDKDDKIPFDQRKVRALLINKEFQFWSNEEISGGYLKKVLGSKGFSQLFD